MSSTETTANKNQGGIQSLEIGLSVLDVLIDYHKPMMLKDIAQAMQMHPAKVHRYLVSLIRKDYARKLSDGRYGLGARVNALGHTSFDQNNILQRLTNAATEIKNAINCGVQIAKWFSEGPIVIHSFEPDSPISIITRIGSRMPLASSATGRLFASYQPETIIKPLVLAEWQGDIDILATVPTTKPDNADLSAKWQAFTELQIDIRMQGYATVAGDMLMGINAISIPVILPQPKDINDIDPSANDVLLEYALTIIGTAEQLPLDNQQVKDRILAIAKRYQIA
ncbi:MULTISPECIES: IclR family transcriptional regulator [unclassified Psychrobacter]|uniref:IclR family transcriptional regulator n=1 Tax=unclassified Psychrobacter TaxID=196806 RepID=UPI00071E8F36|nr:MULTISPECIES: helix-turn-helix domain-containing protein [unclassified Psychrobacter]OLF38166.1 IclR family transcriptional regulator [Psychrobacter sp. Cmf 22.2]